MSTMPLKVDDGWKVPELQKMTFLHRIDVAIYVKPYYGTPNPTP